MTVTFTTFGPPPVFDRWTVCPDCGVDELGVRVINDRLQLLAAHTAGARRVKRAGDRCRASEKNVAPLTSEVR